MSKLTTRVADALMLLSRYGRCVSDAEHNPLHCAWVHDQLVRTLAGDAGHAQWVRKYNEDHAVVRAWAVGVEPPITIARTAVDVAIAHAEVRASRVRARSHGHGGHGSNGSRR